MTISWFGNNCFKIQSKETVVLTDLFDVQNGLKAPRIGAADILTFSNPEAIPNKGPQEAFVISGPGEYEVKGTFIYGYPVNGTIIYIINVEGLQIVHLGNLSKEEIPTEALEHMEQADILMIPVGGDSVLDASKAARLVQTIEPRLVLPMMYRATGVTTNLAPVDPFLKEMGVKVAPQDKIKISVKDLPQDSMQVMLLNLA